MKLFKRKEKLKRKTSCFCPECNNELISSNSFVKDDLYVTYKCKQCSTISNWDFDMPVPVLIKRDIQHAETSNQLGEGSINNEL